MSITLNGVAIQQPENVVEEQLQIQKDRIAISGTYRRYYLGTKNQVTLKFSWLKPSDYQQIINLVAGNTLVTYINTSSSYGTFTVAGYATFGENPYVEGASLYRTLQVIIRQA